MDRHSKAIYKRGALVVVPIVAIVALRLGPRACSALDRSAAREESAQLRDEENAELRQAALLASAEGFDEAQRARARLVPTATATEQAETIASGQPMPDALAVDAQNVAWLATRSGDVVVAPRKGGAPRVVAKGQKLPFRRHVQGLALAGGYVYWITATGAGSEDEDGAILRVPLAVAQPDPARPEPAEPEVVASGLGGISALLVDKNSVYYTRGLRVSRDEDGGATGGAYRLELDRTGKPSKTAQLLFAAERPCGIAVDDASVYVVETQKLWRAPKTRAGNGKGPIPIATGSERLGCSVAVDRENVYWTIPGEDSVMRAKKSDGSGVGVVAFTRKRPTSVVVDQGYAYVLAETSPQALGELGSIFKVALRSERLTPQALVTDQIGLNAVAASGGYVAFSKFNEAEQDGTVMAIREPDAGP